MAFAQEMTNSKTSADHRLRLSVLRLTLPTSCSPNSSSEHLCCWLESQDLTLYRAVSLCPSPPCCNPGMCDVSLEVRVLGTELGTGQRACACCEQKVKASQKYVVKWSPWNRLSDSGLGVYRCHHLFATWQSALFQAFKSAVIYYNHTTN